MNNKTAEHNPVASDSARFFCTQISSAASVEGEFKKHRKEPNMANRNTNPGIGKSADFGVMHSPQPSRTRTRTRGMSYGDINNIPIESYHARVYARASTTLVAIEFATRSNQS